MVPSRTRTAVWRTFCHLFRDLCSRGISSFCSVLFCSGPLFPSYAAAADLDGDLDLDVVSVSYLDGRIVWYENTDGAGTFATGKDIHVLDSASSVVAVDLDNDGDMDLVVAEAFGGRIVWFENTDGLASFSTAIDIAVDLGVREVCQILEAVLIGGRLILSTQGAATPAMHEQP